MVLINPNFKTSEDQQKQYHAAYQIVRQLGTSGVYEDDLIKITASGKKGEYVRIFLKDGTEVCFFSCWSSLYHIYRAGKWSDYVLDLGERANAIAAEKARAREKRLYQDNLEPVDDAAIFAERQAA